MREVDPSLETCQDCGNNVEGWLIEDAAWVAIVGSKSGNLCFRCFTDKAKDAGKNWQYYVVVSHLFRDTSIGEQQPEMAYLASCYAKLAKNYHDAMEEIFRLREVVNGPGN